MPVLLSIHYFLSIETVSVVVIDDRDLLTCDCSTQWLLGITETVNMWLLDRATSIIVSQYH